MTWRVCMYAFAYLGCPLVNINTHTHIRNVHADRGISAPCPLFSRCWCQMLRCRRRHGNYCSRRAPPQNIARFTFRCVALLLNWFRVISISPICTWTCQVRHKAELCEILWLQFPVCEWVVHIIVCDSSHPSILLSKIVTGKKCWYCCFAEWIDENSSKQRYNFIQSVDGT